MITQQSKYWVTQYSHYSRDYKPDPEEPRQNLQEYVTHALEGDYNLEASHYKGRVTAWIIFWPFSFLWYFCGNFFTRIFEALSGIYSSIRSSEIKKAVARLPVAAPTPTRSGR